MATSGTSVREAGGDPAAPVALSCSVGVMAHNEEANIGRCLQALLDQRTSTCDIAEIIVIASGCTDRTKQIVHEYMAKAARIRLLVQARREGKASAVNLFLRHARCDILVSAGADTVPHPTAIQRLVEPFADPELGMTGGRPVPINDPKTLLGFAVHLLWELHHHVALQQPKMGELTAYRRVFYRVPHDSAVDEANVEPVIRGQGYRLRYVPEAIVRNRGPESVSDLLKQRRRIYAGHLRMQRDQRYAVSTLSAFRALLALLRCWRWDWRYVVWVPVVVGFEAYGRFLGWVDVRFRRRTHAIWEVARSTKGAIG